MRAKSELSSRYQLQREQDYAKDLKLHDGVYSALLASRVRHLLLSTVVCNVLRTVVRHCCFRSVGYVCGKDV